jgi:hypothetical protein
VLVDTEMGFSGRLAESRWPAADCSFVSAAARLRPAMARPGGPAVAWLGRWRSRKGADVGEIDGK